MAQTPPIPLLDSLVAAGFPSPADDFIDQSLDLNQLMIPHPASTFFVRVSGDSMTGAGINDQDILIVDRSLPIANNRIIVAAIQGEVLVKRYRRANGKDFLLSENPKYPPVEITPGLDFRLWGVVVYAIHKC